MMTLVLGGCAGGAIDLGDSGLTGDSGPSASCADALVSFDFEGDEQGFTSEETDDGFDDPWDHGSPDDVECHGGDDCWGTGMGGEYGDCEAGALLSPVIDLSACDGVTLSFWHLVRLEEMSSDTWFDGARVEVSGDGGATWDDVDPSEDYDGEIEGNFSECEDSSDFDGEDGWSGWSDDWDEVEIELDSEVLTSEFRVRFWFASDRSAAEDGWFVDDVTLRD
ncbi:MAG: hypothetical protein GY884_04650 [Proteobacteria bacterium]|nr:hypothetical protein [Pseudomonadota bacterium]